MIQDYKAFVDKMINDYEGGYTWDAGDPGGPTKYGITCYDLAEHMGQRMDDMEKWAPIVKAMTLATAEQIYAIKYQSSIRFNDLGPGKDTVMFDYGVNSGPSRPVRVAQHLLNLKEDGIIGPITLAAINKADPVWFINSMCQERLAFMHAIRGGTAWAKFGGGWGKRVANLNSYSLHLAVVGAGSTPTVGPANLSETATPKAKNIPAAPKATKISIGGSVGATVAGAANSSVTGELKYLLIAAAGSLMVTGASWWYNEIRAYLGNNKIVLPPGVTKRVYA